MKQLLWLTFFLVYLLSDISLCQYKYWTVNFEVVVTRQDNGASIPGALVRTFDIDGNSDHYTNVNGIASWSKSMLLRAPDPVITVAVGDCFAQGYLPPKKIFVSGGIAGDVIQSRDFRIKNEKVFFNIVLTPEYLDPNPAVNITLNDLPQSLFGSWYSDRNGLEFIFTSDYVSTHGIVPYGIRRGNFNYGSIEHKLNAYKIFLSAGNQNFDLFIKDVTSNSLYYSYDLNKWYKLVKK